MKAKPPIFLSLLVATVILVAGRVRPGVTLAGVNLRGDKSEVTTQRLAAQPQTREFRRGYEGYDGVQDTYLQHESPTGHGSEQMLHAKETSYGAKRTLMSSAIASPRPPLYYGMSRKRGAPTGDGRSGSPLGLLLRLRWTSGGEAHERVVPVTGEAQHLQMLPIPPVAVADRGEE